jgi:site-specific DNA-cytosine methylase
MRSEALAIDLFCGLGGWTDGLLAEGWDVIGFDIERHHYGDAKYPAQLVSTGRADPARQAVQGWT